MAQPRIEMSLVVIFVVMFLGGAMAQSGCTSALMSISSCLNYVSGSSSTPSSTCCTQLGSVVQSQPQCLCLLLNGGGSSLGISINQTLALALPGACKVETPPVSQCNTAANGPGTAPSPATSPVTSPTDASNNAPVNSPADASNNAPVNSPADASNNAPVNSPADASNEAPETPTSSEPTIPSGTGSKTVPTTKAGTSGGNIVKSSSGITAIAALLSALASIFIKL